MVLCTHSPDVPKTARTSVRLVGQCAPGPTGRMLPGHCKGEKLATVVAARSASEYSIATHRAVFTQFIIILFSTLRLPDHSHTTWGQCCGLLRDVTIVQELLLDRRVRQYASIKMELQHLLLLSFIPAAVAPAPPLPPSLDDLESDEIPVLVPPHNLTFRDLPSISNFVGSVGSAQQRVATAAHPGRRECGWCYKGGRAARKNL